MSFGYCFFEHNFVGSLDVDALKNIGLKPGKIYGDLQKGKTVVLDDGTIIDSKKFLLDPTRGRRVIIAGDNCNPNIITDKFNDLDLLVHESTYTQEVYDNLEVKVKHTTAKQLSVALKNTNIKNLIATHISPRYITNPIKKQKDINLLYQELTKDFKGDCYIANDFDTFLLDRKSFELKLV